MLNKAVSDKRVCTNSFRTCNASVSHRWSTWIFMRAATSTCYAYATRGRPAGPTLCGVGWWRLVVSVRLRSRSIVPTWAAWVVANSAFYPSGVGKLVVIHVITWITRVATIKRQTRAGHDC